MDESAATWQRVTTSMVGPLQRFTGLVRELGGDNTKALTLYGSVVGGAFDNTQHTARSVLIVVHVDLNMLRRLAEHGTTLGKDRIAAPLVMTPKYIEDSLDTFPLELLEIQQRSVTVVGEDYFAPLSFEPAHVRLQCERELKTMLIGLRQGLLAAAGKEKLLSSIETGVSDSLMRTLRGMLWLKEDKEPKPANRVLEAVEKTANRKLPGIAAALAPVAPHGWTQFEALYRDVEALGDLADAW